MLQAILLWQGQRGMKGGQHKDEFLIFGTALSISGIDFT